AGKRYRQTLRLDPDHADAHHNLGVIFALGGELEEALEHHRWALRVEPDHAEAHNSLGLVYAQQGRLDLAAEHYQASLRSDPNHPDTHVNLGNVLVAQGKPQEAADSRHVRHGRVRHGVDHLDRSRRARRLVPAQPVGGPRF
ncbi:MAG: tetratricopeptide repeat protein, partial [Acidobacteria bacterium]|nr:tetratricopeptide repeat protein [Acidobacteriota bacterium]